MSDTALHRLALAALLLAVGAAAAVSTQLAGGPLELGRHWWSTLAVAVPSLVAAGLWLTARRR